jgi:hypothetical protein
MTIAEMTGPQLFLAGAIGFWLAAGLWRWGILPLINHLKDRS